MSMQQQSFLYWMGLLVMIGCGCMATKSCKEKINSTTDLERARAYKKPIKEIDWKLKNGSNPVNYQTTLQPSTPETQVKVSTDDNKEDKEEIVDIHVLNHLNTDGSNYHSKVNKEETLDIPLLSDLDKVDSEEINEKEKEYLSNIKDPEISKVIKKIKTNIRKFEHPGDMGTKTVAYKHLIEEVKSIERRLTILEDQNIEEGTAFVACFSKNGYHKIKKHKFIKFDMTRLNIGKSYKEKTGIFWCPVEAIYRFQLTIFVPSYHRVHIEILVNKKAVTHIVVNPTGRFIQSSISVLTKCHLDNKVQVRTVNSVTLFEYESRCYNSFSGHIVKML